MIEYLAIAGLVLFAAYLYRADFAKYSIFTVGVFKRVTRKRSESGVACTESLCENEVSSGEVRIASKEIVVAGCVMLRYGSVENHYCSDHTSFEFRRMDFKPSTVEKLNETVIQAIVHFSTWVQLPAEEREDSTFNDVTTATQSAFDLAGVAVIVLIAAAMISIINALSGGFMNGSE